MSRRTRSEARDDLTAAIRAYQVANDIEDEVASKVLGVNRTDGRCLDLIDQAGGQLTAGELARQTGLTTAAITGVIDRLEKIGYARRVADPTDRRRVLIEITGEFRQKAYELYSWFHEHGEPAMKRFTIEQVDVVTDFLRVSRDLAERHAAWMRQKLE